MRETKVSGDLVHLFQDLIPHAPNIAQRKMFGFLCAFVNGNLFAGISQQSLMFRLTPAHYEAFLRQEGAARLEPRPGYFSKSFVVFQDPLSVADDVLAMWMQRALAFASRMPPKEKRRK